MMFGNLLLLPKSKNERSRQRTPNSQRNNSTALGLAEASKWGPSHGCIFNSEVVIVVMVFVMARVVVPSFEDGVMITIGWELTPLPLFLVSTIILWPLMFIHVSLGFIFL